MRDTLIDYAANGLCGAPAVLKTSIGHHEFFCGRGPPARGSSNEGHGEQLRGCINQQKREVAVVKRPTPHLISRPKNQAAPKPLL